MEIRGSSVTIAAQSPTVAWFRRTSAGAPTAAVDDSSTNTGASTSASTNADGTNSTSNTALQSLLGTAVNSETAQRLSGVDEVVYHYVLDVDRGCPWEDALSVLDAAKAEHEAAVANSSSSSANSRSAGGNRWREKVSNRSKDVLGFYVTLRSGGGGQHYVLLAVEKSYTYSRPYNVLIIRPTTGRNEMDRYVLKDRYRPVKSLQEAEKLWKAQLQQGAPNAAAFQTSRRFVQHHLLTGAVLSVWRAVEGVFEMYTRAGGVRTFTMRVARAQAKPQPQQQQQLLEAAATTTSKDGQPSKPDGDEDVRGARGGRKGKVGDAKTVTLTTSPCRGGGDDTLSGGREDVCILGHSGGREDDSEQLIGVWIPHTRVEQVLKALRSSSVG